MSDKPLRYKVHIQNKGWTDWFQEGSLAGTVGESLQLEAIVIEGVDEYRVHIEGLGWSEWYKEGKVAGTTGKNLRIEAIEIRGTDVNYQVHVQNVGWLNWARNGETSGTESKSLRVEAVRIVKSANSLTIDNLSSHLSPAPQPVPVAPSAPAAPAQQGTKSGHVYVAPGHGVQTDGVWDCGCTDGDYTEADLMQNIAVVVARNLRDWGIEVTTEADTGNDKNMVYSVAAANEVGADLYISLHCDYNLAPSGTYPIVYPGSGDGINFATAVNNSVMAVMGIGTRGILQRDDYEVSYTDMPACIFETGSICRDINKLLDVEKYGYAVAQGIYDAI